MLSTLALMEVLLVLAAVMTLVVVTTAATADTAFARPAIGGAPPGAGAHNIAADNPETNPGVANRTEPRTGGQSPHFQD